MYVRNIEDSSGEVWMARVCNCWHTAVVYQRVGQKSKSKTAGIEGWQHNSMNKKAPWHLLTSHFPLIMSRQSGTHQHPV